MLPWLPLPLVCMMSPRCSAAPYPAKGIPPIPGAGHKGKTDRRTDGKRMRKWWVKEGNTKQDADIEDISQMM